MFREHVDPEPFSRVKVSVSAGLVTDAHQHQNGIDRNRRKCVGGHAFHSAIIVNADDGYPASEAPHGAAKFFLSGTHGLNEICTTNAALPVRCAFRYAAWCRLYLGYCHL